MLLTRRFIVFLLVITPLTSIADTIILVNGDQLQGTITSQNADSLTFSHSVLGELNIARSQVKSLVESGSEIAAGQVAPGESEQAEPEKAVAESSDTNSDNGLFNSGWLTDWKRKLSVGIFGSAGKSENSKINIGFTADFEDNQERWKHKTSYYRYESEGDLSDHSLTSSLNHDWLLPDSPKFYFAGGHIDFDEFKDWDQRLGINAGIGYEFIETETWRLIGRAGLGVNQTFGGTREETTLEGLLGAEAHWKISDSQSLAITNTLHPNLSDSGEFRNLSSLDWELELDNSYELGLKLGLTNEYDSLNTDDENDFKYSLSIVMGL